MLDYTGLTKIMLDIALVGHIKMGLGLQNVDTDGAFCSKGVYRIHLSFNEVKYLLVLVKMRQKCNTFA